jgi:hypothetical protein
VRLFASARGIDRRIAYRTHTLPFSLYYLRLQSPPPTYLLPLSHAPPPLSPHGRHAAFVSLPHCHDRQIVGSALVREIWIVRSRLGWPDVIQTVSVALSGKVS